MMPPSRTSRRCSSPSRYVCRSSPSTSSNVGRTVRDDVAPANRGVRWPGPRASSSSRTATRSRSSSSNAASTYSGRPSANRPRASHQRPTADPHLPRPPQEPCRRNRRAPEALVVCPVHYQGWLVAGRDARRGGARAAFRCIVWNATRNVWSARKCSKPLHTGGKRSDPRSVSGFLPRAAWLRSRARVARRRTQTRSRRGSPGTPVPRGPRLYEGARGGRGSSAA